VFGFVRRWVEEWRPGAVTLGQPVFPLLVLFGLNAADELDRAGFAVLLPDIRDHFGLADSTALAIVSAGVIAGLLVSIPLAFYADRRRRVRIATAGAALWGLFSVGTALAVSAAMLVAVRMGASSGRAVVEPTHPSLLADWYPPAARVKVFSVHRQANSVGQVLGPLLAGLIAHVWGWRAAFFAFAVPTMAFVLLALRLREPVRGYHERILAGADPEMASREDVPETVRGSFRVLSGVRTIRRIWLAVPFLAVALFAVPNLLSLVYRDVFGLGSAERGLIAAGVEPLQILGVFWFMPYVARKTVEEPGFLLRFVAAVGIADATLLVVLAYAPHVAVAIGAHALLAGSIGTLAPAFFALLSIVTPPRVRSATFSAVACFAIPGIAVFLPLIGLLSDSLGVQASMVTLVPVALTAGFILASAKKFVVDDIAAVHADALARVAEPDRLPTDGR
jgi:branched-chain amino acid transport system ATP-binding protein